MSLKIIFKNRGGVESMGQIESIKAGETLLDHSEAAGLKVPYGCRSGSCGACRVRVTLGLEHLKPRSPLEEDTWTRCQDTEDVRLACRTEIEASAQGKIQIEAAPDVVVKFDDDDDRQF